MNRLIKFESFAQDLMLGKLYGKLTTDELRLCREFLITNAGLDRNQFCEKVNRWYLDNPNKPKHLTDMWALVLQSAG